MAVAQDTPEAALQMSLLKNDVHAKNYMHTKKLVSSWYLKTDSIFDKFQVPGFEFPDFPGDTVW